MSTIRADNISPVGSTLTLTAPVAGLSVAGGLTVGGIAFFSGGVTFNSTSAFSGGVTFNSTTDHAGVARFASTSTFTGLVTLTGGATSAAVISCATAPTQGHHLANKAYVDSNFLNNSSNVKVMSFSGIVASGAGAYTAQPTITAQSGGSGVTFTVVVFYSGGNVGGWYLQPSVGTWVYLYNYSISSGGSSSSSGIVTPTSGSSGLTIVQGGAANTSATSSVILIRIA